MTGTKFIIELFVKISKKVSCSVPRLKLVIYFLIIFNDGTNFPIDIECCCYIIMLLVYNSTYHNFLADIKDSDTF